MQVAEKLKKLRQEMNEAGVDLYVIPSADFHQSEYVGDYFKARAFISGFTGSAGTVVVGEEEACLWTDGRYFIQAARELDPACFTLMKMGEPDVPTVAEYLEEKLPEGGTLGFDGRVVSLKDGEIYQALAEKKGGKIRYDRDLLENVWTDRPALSEAKAWLLPLEYAGKSSADKIQKLRQDMKKEGADVHLIAALDDVCWLLNMRGDDVLYSPMVLSYLVLTAEEILLFINEKKLNDDLKASFKELGVQIKPYNDVYAYVKELKDGQKVLLDPMKVNYALYMNLDASLRLIEKMNPSQVDKAMKNPTEIENFRQAHIKDGVAWARFMYWLKNTIGKEEITEISAAEKLDAFRQEQGDWISPSFGPIMAYGENAAIVHYSASEESNATLEPKGLLLSDTGGNYKQGTTDITRTVALGPITDEQRHDFTLVLVSNLDLAMAHFPLGTHGYTIDMLARAPFWNIHKDFNHGTGHGVGYLLSVHEGPAGFRYKIIPEKGESFELREGMVISNEPGLYIEGSHGIRIENLITIVKDEKNQYGQFMHFEPLTLVPIDLDAIDPSMLSEKEKVYLNDYHKKVYDTISPYLKDEKEKAWLKEYTREI